MLGCQRVHARASMHMVRQCPAGLPGLGGTPHPEPSAFNLRPWICSRESPGDSAHLWML